MLAGSSKKSLPKVEFGALNGAKVKQVVKFATNHHFFYPGCKALISLLVLNTKEEP
jgi:hypothetical protein